MKSIIFILISATSVCNLLSQSTTTITNKSKNLSWPFGTLYYTNKRTTSTYKTHLGTKNCVSNVDNNYYFKDSSNITHNFPNNIMGGNHCEGGGPSTGYQYPSKYIVSDTGQYTIYGSNLCAVNGSASLKYVVLGVYYAPPGTNSNVIYSDENRTGTSFSLSKSMTNGHRLEFKGSIGIPIIGGERSLLTDYNTKKENSETKLEEISNSFGKTFTGPPRDGIDHNYDIIRIWLNPKILLSEVNQNETVYDFTVDTRDPDVPFGKMDVIDVYAGVLNGTIKDPAFNDVWDRFKRAWAGENQHITESEVIDILARDPFVARAGVPALTIEQARAAYPNRFQLPYARNLTYLATPPGKTPNITTALARRTAGLTSSSSEDKTFSVSMDRKYNIDWWIVKGSLTHTSYFSWTEKYFMSNTQQDTHTSTINIADPSSSWNGGTSLVVWQDNKYGTYLFELR